MRRRRYLRTYSFREAAREILAQEIALDGGPGARLSWAEFVRALHAGEDFLRLRELARRVLGSSLGVEIGSPPVRHETKAARVTKRIHQIAQGIATLTRIRAVGVREPFPEDALERLLDGPESEIDLARGALLVAREDEPELDVWASLDRIDKLAGRLRKKLEGASDDPWERIALTNEFIFDDVGFEAEVANDPARRLADLHLELVLKRKRGHCLGLSVLYLALGERVGLPVFGVSCPNHFFVRYEDGKGARINLEMTLRGAIFPDTYYVQRYRLSPRNVDNGLYLGNLAKKQVLVEILNNRANCYWDQGDAAHASRDLDRVARASRSFAPGYMNRGFLALQRGDFGTAVPELRKAIEIDPAFTRAYLHLADAYLKEGSTDKAEVELARWLELDPQSALAHTNLGRVHARRGNHAAAIAAHEKALQLDPRCHIAWNLLGVARRATGDEKGAREAFQQALAIAPKFLAARQNLALVQRATHHRLRAVFSVKRVVNAYREKLARSPDDDGLHAAFAKFLVDVKADPAIARKHAEQACLLAADSVRACEALAMVERAAGDLPRAIKLLERAVALAPGRAGADEPRLRVLLESWRNDRAAAAIEKPPV